MQEDILELKNIFISDPKAEIDLSCILGTDRKISQILSSENFFKVFYSSRVLPPFVSHVYIPSFSCLLPVVLRIVNEITKIK